MYSPLASLSWILEGMGGSIVWGDEDCTTVVVDECSRLTWIGAQPCTTGRGLDWTGKEAAKRRSSSIASDCIDLSCVTLALVELWACWRIVVSWLKMCCGSPEELSFAWGGVLCCRLTWSFYWELPILESSESSETLSCEECKCECKRSTKTDFFPVIGLKCLRCDFKAATVSAASWGFDAPERL